jgi:hypothetical protein
VCALLLLRGEGGRSVVRLQWRSTSLPLCLVLSYSRAVVYCRDDDGNICFSSIRHAGSQEMMIYSICQITGHTVLRLSYFARLVSFILPTTRPTRSARVLDCERGLIDSGCGGGTRLRAPRCLMSKCRTVPSFMPFVVGLVVPGCHVSNLATSDCRS